MHPSTSRPALLLARRIGEALRPPQRTPTVVLLGATLAMLAWRYAGEPGPIVRPVAAAGAGDAAGAITGFVSCFVLLGAVPAAITAFVFRARLADYGVGIGILSRTFPAIVLPSPVFVAAAYAASRDPAILAKFPINPRAGESAEMFALHAAAYVLFYAGWEFMFRGFILFGLRPSVGDATAVLVQTLASALLHIGSPAAETFGAIPAGVLWGATALWTRSLLPSLVQHAVLGIALDAFIVRRG